MGKVRWVGRMTEAAKTHGTEVKKGEAGAVKEYSEWGSFKDNSDWGTR